MFNEDEDDDDDEDNFVVRNAASRHEDTLFSSSCSSAALRALSAFVAAPLLFVQQSCPSYTQNVFSLNINR